MDLFNEIDDLSDLFLLEKNKKLDSPVEEFEDLKTRYSSLHEDYAKEIENSKKVGKCLVKCLKFYSKLCKKYEAQQKIISSLEETVKEKIIRLEEAQRNEEKMRGLVQVYRSERAFYVGQANNDLRKDKEILLDICCRLIGESVRNNNIRNLTNLLLRKFKKDLDNEKINLLKRKNMKFKNESECDVFGDVKSDFICSLKNEMNFKTEEKYSEQMNIECVPEPEEVNTKNDPLDLSMCKPVSEAKKYPEENNSTSAWEETSQNEPEFASSLPLLEELPPPPKVLCTDSGNEPINHIAENNHLLQMVSESTEVTFQVGMGDCNPEVTEEGAGIPPPRNDSVAKPLRLLESEPKDRSLKKPPFQSVTYSRSIFDVSDDCLNTTGFKTEAKEREDVGPCPEIKFGSLFEEKDKLDEVQFANDADILNVDFRNLEEVAEEEEELVKILREMSSVRLPSPVREISDSSGSERSKGCNLSKGELGHKRHLVAEESSCKNKKLKASEERERAGLLDSIMSAMSIQNEEFKSKGWAMGESEGSAEGVVGERGYEFSSLGTRTSSRRKKLDHRVHSKENSSVLRQSPRTVQNKLKALEDLVMEEIKHFVSTPISCKEDADKNVKHCLSVLSSKSEEMIVRCIVATVLENVDEVVEAFERPAPPLTRTQQRLIVLLSVFRTFDPNSDKISISILSLISQKLFPDNFFWPDDSVEAATRFYAALCRARNEPKILWKFCLQAVTDMRQRCPLLMFTVLKTWPDVLHDATTLKNNMLAVTLVNIFLHMPKTEGLRNFNQGRKLIALKHLLMNFYQFKVEDTIEGYARKLVDALRRQEVGAEKSIVLLCKSRDAGWTMKHMLPALKLTLSEWCEEKTEDVVAVKVLSVIKQICHFPGQESTDGAKVKDLVNCLAQILTCGKKNHASEVNIVEVLLQLKQYPEARKVIREWIPKSSITECLRNEIINASAENILRELKLNKRKEAKSVFLKKRLKKQPKKSKGKKKKVKIRKNQLITQTG